MNDREKAIRAAIYCIGQTMKPLAADANTVKFYPANVSPNIQERSDKYIKLAWALKYWEAQLASPQLPGMEDE